MKKKFTFLFAFCVLCSGIILTTDYYRAIYVKNEKNGKDQTVPLFSDEKEIEYDELEKALKETEAKVDELGNGKATVRIFGDNMIHESVLNWANVLAGGEGTKESYSSGFNFVPIYEDLASYIEDADFSIYNQTSLVGANDEITALSGYPLFNSPTKLGEDMISLGFDGINMANNHMLDLSDRGYLNSVSFWKTKDISLFGGYGSESEMNDDTKKIVEIKGIKLGVLSFTASTNGIYPKNETTAIPLYTFNKTAILEKKLKDDVAAVKENADVVVVLINWENSAGERVTEHQEKTAQILADAGADLIVGSGPKVVQKIAYIRSNTTGNQVLCAYSLGNLMGTMKYLHNQIGGYLSFEVEKVAGEVMVQNVTFTPTIIHFDENYQNVAVYNLADYDLEQYQRHGCNQKNGYEYYENAVNTIKNKIPAEFLPESIKNKSFF